MKALLLLTILTALLFTSCTSYTEIDLIGDWEIELSDGKKPATITCFSLKEDGVMTKYYCDGTAASDKLNQMDKNEGKGTGTWTINGSELVFILDGYTSGKNKMTHDVLEVTESKLRLMDTGMFKREKVYKKR